jgi:hypothetical protein
VKIVRPQETSNRNLTFGSVVMAATKMLTNFLQSKKLKFFFFMFVRYWPKYFFNQYHRANWNIAGLTFKTNTSVEIITKRFSCRTFDAHVNSLPYCTFFLVLHSGFHCSETGRSAATRAYFHNKSIREFGKNSVMIHPQDYEYRLSQSTISGRLKNSSTRQCLAWCGNCHC